MKQTLILVKLVLSVLIFIPWASFAGTDGAIQLTKDPRGPITLKISVALALMYNPQLEAFSHEQRAREARALQSGLMPNPELEILVKTPWVQEILADSASRKLQFNSANWLS